MATLSLHPDPRAEPVLDTAPLAVVLMQVGPLLARLCSQSLVPAASRSVTLPGQCDKRGYAVHSQRQAGWGPPRTSCPGMWQDPVSMFRAPGENQAVTVANPDLASGL